MQPLSGVAHHQIADAVAWHGRLMVMAWGVCAPLGILLARYWKIAPKQAFPDKIDSKFWWHGHRFFQWSALALTVVGIGLIYTAAPQVAAKSSRAAGLHQTLGYAILIAVVAQVVHALFRGSKGGPTDAAMRGDHYDMTPWRIFFERTHKSLGWLALLTAFFTIALGLIISDAPRWMPLSLGIWWIGLAALALRWQRTGRCIDTYQAIWGIDAAHPGNAADAAAPIGIGIRRSRDLR